MRRLLVLPQTKAKAVKPRVEKTEESAQAARATLVAILSA